MTRSTDPSRGVPGDRSQSPLVFVVVGALVGRATSRSSMSIHPGSVSR